jgi:hypothetical protein
MDGLDTDPISLTAGLIMNHVGLGTLPMRIWNECFTVCSWVTLDILILSSSSLRVKPGMCIRLKALPFSQ